jgi:hypothetical protein
MKRSRNELKKVTLSMGVLSLALGLLILQPLYDIKAAAQSTISRLPASLVPGAIADVEKRKVQMVTKLKFPCNQLSQPTTLETEGPYLQLEFTDCQGQLPKELLNLTNGFEGTLFESTSSALSDLIALNSGENEIHIRQEKALAPVTFKVINSRK